MKYIVSFLFIFLFLPLSAQSTYRQNLSGTGLNHTVTWDFYCSDGHNSKRWSKIEVPSQWELQGFGDYTYGRWYKEKGVKNPSMETGTYRHTFKVPGEYKNHSVRIVFDGVMTDAEVFVNGSPAGPVHQGGFYRFSYDITNLVRFGRSNKLEVVVRKHSANKSVNAAERKADWWLFGGIYRPVWLEIKPQTHIDRVAVDASADGELRADVSLSGAQPGYRLSATVAPLGGSAVSPQGGSKSEEQFFTLTDTSSVYQLHTRWTGIRPWTPETPNLYLLTLNLSDEAGKILHQHQERIGFRTVEFRPKDGLYVNGVKIVMKGINRHSFHPDGGRTTNREISIQDVLLIKEMNMNAVRSHYPPDTHFLEACDSLGLFVIDELAGWQNAYDATVGKRLLKEMVVRDVNHPSIVLWSNGNEGGWNTSLDKLFSLYDPQQRHVIHPWADFNGLDTHHYPAYLTGVARFTNGYNVFMPTEFMHGQYDQGHGAGLEDFWTNYTSHPLFAGGFMWAFSDEAVRRTDRGGQLDSDRFNAPDGIVGPYREREGSVYTVREVWAPIQFRQLYITPSFKGEFAVTNTYLYTNLRDCRMNYRLYRCPSPLQSGADACCIDSGMVQLPALAPGETGYARMTLPSCFREADVLELEASGPDGKSICTWTWPIRYADDYLKREISLADQPSNQSPHQPSASSSPRVSAQNSRPASISNDNDSLVTLSANGISVSFRKSDATIARIEKEDGNGSERIAVPLTDGPLPVGMKMEFTRSALRMDGDDAVFCAHYRGGVDSIQWRMSPSGLLSMNAVLLNRASGGGGFDDAFMDEAVLNLGLTFSYPEAACTGMRWMGRGPYRVWKNRVKGTNYAIWQKDYNNTITGESFEQLVYPEFKGYHANLYWATIENKRAPFTVFSATDGLFFRLFTPEEPAGRQNGANTMPDFPAGDLSFLLDIPAIRSFKPVSQHGPHSQPGNVRIKKGDEGLRIRLLFDFR